jgi:hypothetical protein
MMPTRLNLLRLQRNMRGLRVARAGVSVGTCLLVDFGVHKGRQITSAAARSLLIELARWELRRHGAVVASDRSRRSVAGDAVAAMTGTHVVDASIGTRGVRLILSKGFALQVQKEAPSCLGPGWARVDQWVLFLDGGAALVQPVRGAIVLSAKG